MTPSPLAPCPARTSMAAPPEEPAPRCGLAACTRTSGAASGRGPGPPPAAGPRTCLCGPQGLGPCHFSPATVLRGPRAGFLGRFSRPSAAPSTVQGTLRPLGAKAESAGGWGLRSVLPASESSLYFPHLCLRLKHLFFFSPLCHLYLH